MSKHTPWEIEWGNPIAIGDGVAFVPQSLDGTHTANAYLISQAPAMLEALEALMLAREQDKYRSWEKGVPEFNKAETLARAAIKAAKGEA